MSKRMESSYKGSDLFLALLLFLLILVLSPLILGTILSLLIWRQIVKVLSRVLTKFERMASGQDMLFMMDNIYGKPHSAIPFVMILDQPITLPIVEQHFSQLFDRNRSDYEDKYEKLKLYPVKWLGFCFWNRDKAFKVSNHVTLVKVSGLGSNTLTTFIGSIIRNPFNPETSPWEVLVVPNYEEESSNKSLVVLRFHHTLMDGMSFAKMVWKLLEGSNPLPANYGKPKMSSTALELKRSFWDKFIFWLKCITIGPYIYLKELMEMRDDNCIQPSTGIIKSGNWVCSATRPISFTKVKQVAKVLKSGVTAVVIAAISSGLRKYIIKYNSEDEVQGMHSISSVPLPNHPNDMLTNHFTAIGLGWPISLKTTQDRLEYLNREIPKKASSMFPIISRLMFSIVGIMPVSMIETATSFKSATILFTNIPGFDGTKVFAGIPVNTVIFWVPPTREATAMSTGMVTNNGSLIIPLVAEKTCFESQDRLDELAELIYAECQNIFEETEMEVNNKLD